MEFTKVIADKRAEKATLEASLMDPAVLGMPKKLREVNANYQRVNRIIAVAEAYEKMARDLDGARAALNDADEDVRTMAAEEVAAIEPQMPALEQALELALIPADPIDSHDAIVEIRAGTGGDEAALFASDLYRMYTRYAERHGWKFAIVSQNQNDLG